MRATTHFSAALLLALILAVVSQSSPITYPYAIPTATHQVHAQVWANSGGEGANVTAIYRFAEIPPDIRRIAFPVALDADLITLWQNGDLANYTWCNDQSYPTDIPELDTLSMIQLWGPFPEDEPMVFTLKYRMPLLDRDGIGVFYSPTGYAKLPHMSSAEIGTDVFLQLPWSHLVDTMWLGSTVQPHARRTWHATTSISSNSPIRNDLVVTIVPKFDYTLTISPAGGDFYTTQFFDVVIAVGDADSVAEWEFWLGNEDITDMALPRLYEGTTPDGLTTMRLSGLSGAAIEEAVGVGRQQFTARTTMLDGSVREKAATWHILENEEDARGLRRGPIFWLYRTLRSIHRRCHNHLIGAKGERHWYGSDDYDNGPRPGTSPVDD